MTRHIYGWVGDSITEGYDDGLIVSCKGVPGRLQQINTDITSAVSAQHLNMGASGRLVPQYIDIAKAIIDADPTLYTGIFCSCWSPNVPQGETVGVWPITSANMNAMFTALEDFEDWLVARSIIFIPTFMAGSPFEMNDPAKRIALQGHLDRCIARWPWLLNLNTPIQDPGVTDGPYILVPTYTGDSTHPNAAGYAAMTSYAVSNMYPKIQYAINYYTSGTSGTSGTQGNLPELLRLMNITGGQDFTSTINNDGSFGFNPSGGPATFKATLKNVEDAAITSVELVMESIEISAAPTLDWAIQNGSWYNYGSSAVPANSGTIEAPKIHITSAMNIGTWQPDATVNISVVMTSGLWTNARTFGNGLWPDSQQVSNPQFYAGDHLNDNPGGGVGIGPFNSRLIGRLASSAAPRAILEMFGDSTVCETAPVAAVNGNSKEGVWFRSNRAAQTSGYNIRTYSRANGGFEFNQIMTRIDANLPYLSGYCTHVGVPMWTWNSPITSVSAADAQWTQYLAKEAAISAAGLIPFPFVLHPPSTRNSAGELSAHARCVELTLTRPRGIYFGDIFAEANGIDLKAAWSEDNVHLNPIGATSAAPQVANRIRQMVQIDYPSL